MAEVREEVIIDVSVNEAGKSAAEEAKDVQGLSNTLEGLTKRNKELRAERKQLDITTEAGRKRVAQINDELNKNTNIIKENSSALEQQRMNVGNYTGAVDKLVPGLGATINGIQGMTKAGLAFIATPIGMILGAIALALGAVMSYLKGTEEGQDKLNSMTQVASAIWAKFGDLIRMVGKWIVAAVENPQQAIKDLGKFIQENLTNRLNGLMNLIPNLSKAINLLFKGEFAEAGKVAADAMGMAFLGVENVTEKVKNLAKEITATVDLAVKQGQMVAKLQKEIRLAERRYELDSANTFLKVSELKLKAEQTVGAERKKAVEEAIALEQRLSDQNVALFQKRFDLAKQQADIADNDIEANNALVKAEADLIRAKAERFNKVKELATKLFGVEQQIRAEELAIQQQIAAAELEQFNNNIKFLQEKNTIALTLLKEQYANELITKEEFEANFTDLEMNALLERKAFLEANGQEVTDIENQIADKRIKALEKIRDAEKKLAEEKKKITEDEQASKENAFEQSIALAERAFGENKAVASATTLASTWLAAQQAFLSQFLPIPTVSSPIRGSIAAGIAITQGLGRVAAINGLALAGGGDFYTKGPQLLLVGDNPGGVERVTVEPVSGKGTTRQFNGMIAMAGGGSVTAGNMITSQAANNQSTEFRRMVDNINKIQTVLVLQDFEAKKKSVDDVRQRATVIE